MAKWSRPTQLARFRIARESADAWRVPLTPRVTEWVPRYIRIPDEVATDSNQFDLDSFPHVRGVLEAADDDRVREIYLRWSTRNGKTLTALAILIALCANTGRPGVFASSDEAAVADTINSEVYPMLEACEITKHMLLAEHLRSEKKGVVIGRSRIRRAYAGSAATFARYQAVYGLATEVGLWSKNMLPRFRQRARLFPFDRKLIFEGKPEEANSCAISYLVEHSNTQRRYYHVPCPHCGVFQRLQWGDSKPDTPGIKWQQPAKGNFDARLARKTAHYRCLNGCKIENQHRAEMMRLGVWCPEGCEVQTDGTLTGTPEVDGENVAFDGLSALYSLKVSGWGDLVIEWLQAKDDPDLRREFMTGTLAEQWTNKPVDLDTTSVRVRISSEISLGVCPEWSIFLTRAIDLQTQAVRYEFPWGVFAWGPGGRGHLVDYGVEYGWDSLLSSMRQQVYRHADGGLPLRPAWTALDSGDATNEVYEFCRTHHREFRLVPVKGMNIGGAEHYRLTPLDDQQQRGRLDLRQQLLRGQCLLMGINTDLSQDWMESNLRGSIERGKPNSLQLANEAALDETLLQELLNEQQILKLDKTNHQRKSWVRRDSNRPNDMRDVARYARTLAQFVTNNGRDWDKLPARSAAQVATSVDDRSQKPVPSFLQGGGRKWSQ